MANWTSLELLLDRLIWRQAVDTALIKYAGLKEAIDQAWEKAATPADVQSNLGSVLGGDYLPFTRAPFMPNKPHAMTNALLGGLAGAGLGYGAASLAGTILPADWNKKRLRWLGAIGGAGLGAAPGLSMGLVNLGAGLPFNDARMWQPGYNVADADAIHERMKQSQVSDSGLSFDSQEFEDMIWKDPRVAKQLDPQVQAGAAGLVSGAAALRGDPGGWVTPIDIARIAAGMGVGYTSGALVGGALGLMMGMPERTQEQLKQTGFWAGALSKIVPIAFGGR